MVPRCDPHRGHVCSCSSGRCLASSRIRGRRTRTGPNAQRDKMKRGAKSTRNSLGAHAQRALAQFRAPPRIARFTVSLFRSAVDMATDSFYGEKESVARALGGWGELAKPRGPNFPSGLRRPYESRRDIRTTTSKRRPTETPWKPRAKDRTNAAKNESRRKRSGVNGLVHHEIRGCIARGARSASVTRIRPLLSAKRDISAVAVAWSTGRAALEQAAMGNASAKTLPASVLDSSQRRPPCCSARRLLMCRPRPVPGRSRVRDVRKKGVKSRSVSSLGTPIPWSFTRDRLAIDDAQRNIDGRVVRAELERVVQEVAQDLRDAVGIAAHPHRFRRRECDTRNVVVLVLADRSSLPRRRGRTSRPRGGARPSRSVSRSAARSSTGSCASPDRVFGRATPAVRTGSLST